MYEDRDFCDLPRVYARAEPDDEYYDPEPDLLDPRMIEEEEGSLHDEEEEEEEDDF